MGDRPMTMDDYLASRMVSEPFRLFDCCLENDGACAVVVTTAERARRPGPAGRRGPGERPGDAAGLRPRAVHQRRHARRRLHQCRGPEGGGPPVGAAAAGRAADVDVAQIYDHFTGLVLLSLEDFGFCGRGEGGPFAASGALAWPDGALPTNTHGGSLSEAYIHGLNHVVEGVRQLRGQSTCQVAGAETCLVTSAAGVPTSALVLGATMSDPLVPRRDAGARGQRRDDRLVGGGLRTTAWWCSAARACGSDPSSARAGLPALPRRPSRSGTSWPGPGRCSPTPWSARPSSRAGRHHPLRGDRRRARRGRRGPDGRPTWSTSTRPRWRSACAVEVVWEDMGPELALPRFRPVAERARSGEPGPSHGHRARHRRGGHVGLPDAPGDVGARRARTGGRPRPGRRRAHHGRRRRLRQHRLLPDVRHRGGRVPGPPPHLLRRDQRRRGLLRGPGGARRLRGRGGGGRGRPRHLRQHPAVPDGAYASGRGRPAVGAGRLRPGPGHLRRAVGQHPGGQLRPGRPPAHARVRDHPRAAGGGGRDHAPARGVSNPQAQEREPITVRRRGLVAAGGRPAAQARLLCDLRRRRGLCGHHGRTRRRPATGPRSTSSVPPTPPPTT